MKDIDFDELDRAVSSVLSKSTPTDTSVSVPMGQTINAPSRAADSPIVSATAPEPQGMQTLPVEKSENPRTPEALVAPLENTPTNASPITLRSRGKFMDVMHPSADMNPGMSAGTRPVLTPPRSLAPLTSRGADQPESTSTVDEATSLIGAEPVPVIDPSEAAVASHDEPEETLLLPAETDEESSDASAETPSVDLNYVDPLDVATKTSPVTSEGVPAPDNSPQSTPFLSDTKVDKRPLGAFGDVDEQDADVSKTAPDDAQTIPTVPLPRELQPDVVQVESLQEPEQSSASEKPFAAPVGVAVDDTDDGRVEGHPLFDTSTYHEPIAAVHAKKTAPWVFWIVGLGICLVIGAGVGYFLFTAGF